MKEIKVIIAGPRGRMGHEAVLLMERTEHFNFFHYSFSPSSIRVQRSLS
ncbi:hypothetical protein ACT4UM_23980, partial [Bacillus sp. SS-TM]